MAEVVSDVVLMKGARVGEYELCWILGAGGFGTVWLVRTSDDVSFAMKILHPNLIHARGGADRGPTVAERFIAEARMIQKLDYPGFVKIYDIIDCAEEGVIAYVMELLDGRDLTRVISKVSLPVLLEAIAQTAETLGVLHQNGIIHRDVKGANIFICDPAEGQSAYAVKLLDFGIAKELGTDAMLESTATGYFLGTVRSMAPECFRRWTGESHLTGAVDQWSLGVTLFYFLSGKMPFSDGSLATLIHQIESGSPRPLVIRPRYGLLAVPDDLAAIVDRCLAKAPSDRFPTMGDLADALRDVVSRLSGRRTDPTMFDPELAATAVDPSSRASKDLAEARKLAVAVAQGHSSADPFGKTAIADDSERATQLDHPTPARPVSEPSITGPTQVPTISPTSTEPTAPTTAQSLNAEPQPLKGPLILKTTQSKPAEGTDATAPAATLKTPAVDQDSVGIGLDQTFVRTAPAVRQLKEDVADTRLEISTKARSTPALDVDTAPVASPDDSAVPSSARKPASGSSLKRVGILVLSLIASALSVYLLMASTR